MGFALQCMPYLVVFTSRFLDEAFVSFGHFRHRWQNRDVLAGNTGKNARNSPGNHKATRSPDSWFIKPTLTRGFQTAWHKTRTQVMHTGKIVNFQNYRGKNTPFQFWWNLFNLSWFVIELLIKLEANMLANLKYFPVTYSLCFSPVTF